MNTHTDLRWILFATVPVNGYTNADPVMPIARGIAWLYRRAVGSGHRRHPEDTEERGKSLVAPAAIVDHPVP
jgi:hypothetical protein